MGSLRNGAIRARILVWGAPSAGKTTTLTHVSGKLKTNQKGSIKKVTLKNPPCNYELLPVELGEVKGVPTKLDFQTVPGHWDHAATRKRLLQGVDGIIFVASSSGSAMKDNQKSLAELDEALKSMGRSVVTVPIVFQWMNQKAIGSMPPDEMQAKLNKIGAQTFSVPADDQSGILKAFAAISKMAVKVVRDDYDAGKLVEPPSMDLDLDSLAPPAPAPAPAKPADDDNVNPFAGLADDLGDELGDFGDLGESKPAPSAAPARAPVSASVELDSDDADLDALLGGGASAPAAAAKPSPVREVPRTNGAAAFKLVSSGTASLSGDGVLSLPIRIGNDHGEEIALTVTVKVTPG